MAISKEPRRQRINDPNGARNYPVGFILHSIFNFIIPTGSFSRKQDTLLFFLRRSPLKSAQGYLSAWPFCSLFW